MDGVERRVRRQHGAIWATTAGLYFLLASCTIYLTSDGHSVAMVWPANAVMLAMLLRPDRALWFNVLSAGFLGGIAANAITRGTIGAPLLYGFSNLAEVGLAALLLRPHLRGEAILATPATVGRFIIVAGIVAPGVSGILGASTAWLIAHQDLKTSFIIWFTSDALGLLIFTPFMLAVFNGDFARSFADTTRRQRGEALALQILTGLAAYGVFFIATQPLLFALFPPVMLATFRAGRLGTKFSVILVAVIGTIGTTHGLGPIASFTHDALAQAQLLQCFLATLLLTCLPVAADLSARRSYVFTLTRNEAELKDREAELSKLATTDSLTALLNRRAFRDLTSDTIKRADTYPFCLAAIDLDRLKSVNDEFGHAAGDAALLHVTKLLKAQLRSSDVIGRVGGDEFLILLKGTQQKDAEVIVKTLQSALLKTPLVLNNGTTLHLSLSYGVVAFETGMDFDALTDAADTRLYAAKFARAGAYRAA